jgi:anti-sigma28 factor (negative regulator of flagellin synthesis)
MITENGYIETLNEQEAIEWGNYEVVTEEIAKEE